MERIGAAFKSRQVGTKCRPRSREKSRGSFVRSRDPCDQLWRIVIIVISPSSPLPPPPPFHCHCAVSARVAFLPRNDSRARSLVSSGIHRVGVEVGPSGRVGEGSRPHPMDQRNYNCTGMRLVMIWGGREVGFIFPIEAHLRITTERENGKSLHSAILTCYYITKEAYERSRELSN
jgi:hypothetical protein